MIECKPDDYAFARSSDYVVQRGLTKREYFSTMAMQGLLADPNEDGSMCATHKEFCTTIAKAAVNFADALIEELNK